MSAGSNQVEDADVCCLLGSDFVAADHVNVKDDGTGRYAEQLLGHAQHHTGAMLVVLSQPELTDPLSMLATFSAVLDKSD